MTYHLQLTGYVGSQTFCSSDVRKTLAKYKDSHVDILIDSFGGSLAEGLSICGALRDHGDVTVHFRGCNASAATIASMGAKKIVIAPESFYLVHQVSMGFFDWASRNADQLEDFIKLLQSTKEDLDTMDRSIAELYASRCNRKCKDLLDLMKAEKWITAQQAKDWGFVDEITSNDTSSKSASQKITQAQAFAFQSLGLPLPPVGVEEERQSFIDNAINKVVSAIKSINNKTDMKPENQNPSTEEQQPSNEENPSTQESPSTKNQLQAEIDRLKAENEALKKRPAASTASVISPAVENKNEEQPKTAFQRYIETTNSAKKLFDSIP